MKNFFHNKFNFFSSTKTSKDPFENFRATAHAAGFLPGNADARKALFVPQILGWHIYEAILCLRNYTLKHLGDNQYKNLINKVPFRELIPDIQKSSPQIVGLEDVWACVCEPLEKLEGLTAAKHFSLTNPSKNSDTLWLHGLIKTLSDGQFEIGKIVPCTEHGSEVTLQNAFALWNSQSAIRQQINQIINFPNLELKNLDPCLATEFISVVGYKTEPKQHSTFVIDLISPQNNRKLFKHSEELFFVCEWEGARFAFGLPSSTILPLGTGDFLKQWTSTLPNTHSNNQHQFIFVLQSLLQSRAWKILSSSNNIDSLSQLSKIICYTIWERSLRVNSKVRSEILAELLIDESYFDDNLNHALKLLNMVEHDKFRDSFVSLWNQALWLANNDSFPSGEAILKILASEVYAIKKKEERKKHAAKRKAETYHRHWRIRRDDISPASISDIKILNICEKLRNLVLAEIKQRKLGVSAPDIIFSKNDESAEIVYYNANKTIVFPARYLNYTTNFLHSIVIWALSHDLAEEYFKTTQNLSKSYELAWKRLSLEPSFCSTSHRLTETPRHWKEQNSEDQDERKYLERVNKLFALAESSNEAESQLAMERAQEMLLARNMSRHREGRGGQRDMVSLILHLDTVRLANTTIAIGKILAKFYFTKIVYGRDFDTIKSTNMRCIHLLGRRENVLMAEHVFDFLSHKIDALWTIAKKEKNLPGKAKLSYQMGLLKGFSNKLGAMVDFRKAASAKTDSKTDESALISLECQDLDLYTKEKFPSLCNLSTSDYKMHNEGYTLGKEDGAEIVIHAPLNGVVKNQDTRLMLS